MDVSIFGSLLTDFSTRQATSSSSLEGEIAIESYFGINDINEALLWAINLLWMPLRWLPKYLLVRGPFNGIKGDGQGSMRSGHELTHLPALDVHIHGSNLTSALAVG